MVSRAKALAVSVCLLAMVWCEVASAGTGAVKDEPLIKDRKWAEAQAFYARQLEDFAATKGVKSGGGLTVLVLCYDAARYFPKLTGEDMTSLEEWLLDQPDFTATLLAALGPKDSPERVFHVLAQVKQEFGAAKILRYKGLAIAHALVWDREKGKSKKFDATDSFGYYVSNAASMSFDLTTMPYEPALFLACAQAAPDERLWALKDYKRPKKMRGIYGDPGYGGKIPEGQEHTLQNILKYGGICVHRAYFASNVACALGIPAAGISGRGERGGHAWVGYIEPGHPGEYLWNLGCGRYSYDHYFVGTTHDPQTGAKLKDYELAMRTKGCCLPPAAQRLSDCYHGLADLLEKNKEYPLVKWALEQAIRNNPFNTAAWHATMRLCKAGSFEPEYANHLVDEALRQFPKDLDFCYGIFDTLMETVPDKNVDRRVRLYQQAAGFFKPRPDLSARVARAYGDYLMDQGRKDQAYDVYYDAIRAHMKDPMLTADLAIKVTKMRLESDEPKKAVELLQPLIELAKKPGYHDPYAKHSEWYRLQACLAGVYKKMGEEKAAAAIEEELAKFVRL